MSTIKSTSNNSWMASKRLKKATSALKIQQIDLLFAIIFALNLTFLIPLTAHPELIEIPLSIAKKYLLHFFKLMYGETVIMFFYEYGMG